MHTWNRKPDCPQCVYFSSPSRLHNTILTDQVTSTSVFLQFCISKSIVKHHKLNCCLFLFFPADCICLPSRWELWGSAWRAAWLSSCTGAHPSEKGWTHSSEITPSLLFCRYFSHSIPGWVILTNTQFSGIFISWETGLLGQSQDFLFLNLVQAGQDSLQY